MRQAVAQGALSSFQALAIALCIALNMLDGFDILAMSFSASGVKAAWNLPNAELGELFSAGLVGMAAGSLLLAPCADVFGRRRIDRKSTRLNSSHLGISYAVFCLKKKKKL